MTLREYRAKRNFRRTAEPRGAKAAPAGDSFVVQKHAASHLHYDFRLEIGAVLASWAVPKGPSLDPAEKRLAVQVEDHPLEYGDFEGTIPVDEYGGGTVMVWDRGTWSTDDDAAKQLRKGHLSFTLQGEKLRGEWSLVRMKPRGREKKPQWLLMKKDDKFARSTARGDVLEKHPKSAKTGRTMDQIAAGATADKVRSSTTSRRAKPRKKKPAAKGRKRSDPASLTKARRAPLPDFVTPQLATAVAEPPPGDEWLHEMKFDGYRMFCRLDRGAVRFVSRNGKDWTARMTSLVEPVKRLEAQRAALDGEVVVLDAKGISRFQLLQNSFRDHTAARLTFFVFDLVHLDGYDLTATPLEERKQALHDLLAASASSTALQYSEHYVGDAAALHKQACRRGLEGIISKRRAGPYRSGRGLDWQKIKCRLTQEFVVGGFTAPQRSRVGFGSLLLGYYDDADRLTYAGRVGTGFDDRGLAELHQRLQRIAQSRSPFASGPAVPRQGRTTWVRPELVAQIEFANWTDEGLLRQASFEGLREDKPADDVTADRPTKTPRRRAK